MSGPTELQMSSTVAAVIATSGSRRPMSRHQEHRHHERAGDGVLSLTPVEMPFTKTKTTLSASAKRM